MSVFPSRAQSGPQAYMGGYGRAGLTHLRQDPSSGELQELQRLEAPGEPSWLCASTDGRLLYSANEASSTLTVYARDIQGRLKPLQEMASGGQGPVHISLQSGFLLVAHYGSGQLACWRLGDQGLLEGRPRVLDTAQGPGPSHAHMAACDALGQFLLVSDLGQDALLCWRFEPGHGPQGQAQVWRTPAGSGPRHFQFHARLPGQLYLLNETASSLSWLELDSRSGSLSHKLTLSNLPKGYTQTSYASDLRLSPSGRHLYALNRLHDSIAIFELNAEGRPRLLGHEPTRGSYPRSACFGPDGRWFYTCNQRGDSLSRFWVRADGGLHYAGQQAMPSPAMLLFVG